MNTMHALLWGVGAAHLLVAAMNFFLPAKIDLALDLAKVSPLVRQMVIVHHVYIVGVIFAFAGLCFFFTADLAGASRLGSLLAAGMSLFWLARIPIQIFYYDRETRRRHRAVDSGFLLLLAFMAGVLGVAAIGGLR
jgi:hypothetical protein